MQEEKTLLNAVLCFLVTETHILLGVKLKKIGKGCWNGYGGGIDGKETPEQSVVRELHEESNGIVVSPVSLQKVALVDFHNTKSDGNTFICKVYVYFAHQWQGEPKSTEELGDPRWFSKNQLPLDEMMPADRDWLPLVISGKKVIAKAYYGPFQKTLLKPTEIEIVDSLS